MRTIVAALILGLSVVANASEKCDQAGCYDMKPDVNGKGVWIIDTSTGKVRKCFESMDTLNAPECSKWSG